MQRIQHSLPYQVGEDWKCLLVAKVSNAAKEAHDNVATAMLVKKGLENIICLVSVQNQPREKGDVDPVSLCKVGRGNQ